MSLWVLLSSSWGCMHWDSPFHIFWFHFRLKSFLQCSWVSSNQELWLSSWVSSVQFSCSVMSDSLWPHGLLHTGFPVRHQFPELAQTHVHWVGDAIQPSHSLSFPSPPAFTLSQHQSPFQLVISLHQMATVLELQLQLQSFHWIFRTDFL